ncbi:hypothetical protein OIU76_000514 [Salix suchowensis]|nr:hypothetical protein OIU76_000514 [Salix suchowensis]
MLHSISKSLRKKKDYDFFLSFYSESPTGYRKNKLNYAFKLADMTKLNCFIQKPNNFKSLFFLYFPSVFLATKQINKPTTIFTEKLGKCRKLQNLIENQTDLKLQRTHK